MPSALRPAVAWASCDGMLRPALHRRSGYPQANETEVDALYARVAELERFGAACTCQDTRGNLACDGRHTWRTTHNVALSDCAHRPRHALRDRDGAA